VTDLALPGRNGYELARSLQALQPKLKVLFTSAHVGSELSRFYGVAAAGDHFLEKPFQPADLVMRVRDLLERAEPKSGASGS